MLRQQKFRNSMAKTPPPRSDDPRPDDKPAGVKEQAPARDAGLSLELAEFSWRGPLPPPQVLRQINDIVPEGAERLMAQFERETRHRHLLERRAQNYPLFDQLAARGAALVFALACLGVAIHAINSNQPWVAGAFGAATAAIGVNAFLRQSAKPEQLSSSKKPPTAKQ